MKKPNNISKTAQLLRGIGASSWFSIKLEGEAYRIERFSIEGELECSNLFIAEPNTFDLNCEYKFTYISHCKECTIIQKNIAYKFQIYDR